MTVEARRAYMRAWKRRNPEKVKAYGKGHRQRHLEEIRAKDRIRDKKRKGRVRPERKAYAKEYQRRNYDKLRKHARSFYYENRERLLQWKRENPPPKEYKRTYNREWCRRNPGKVCTHRTDRKLKMKTPLEESERINQFFIKVRATESIQCSYCPAVVHGKDAHIDHVIPLSRGGKHLLSNLCVSCQPCNNRKYNKLPHEFLATRQRVLEL